MYNPFLIISIPYAVLLILVTWFIPKHKCIRLRKFCYHKATVFTYIALMLTWWKKKKKIAALLLREKTPKKQDLRGTNPL